MCRQTMSFGLHSGLLFAAVSGCAAALQATPRPRIHLAICARFMSASPSLGGYNRQRYQAADVIKQLRDLGLRYAALVIEREPRGRLPDQLLSRLHARGASQDRIAPLLL